MLGKHRQKDGLAQKILERVAAVGVEEIHLAISEPQIATPGR